MRLVWYTHTMISRSKGVLPLASRIFRKAGVENECRNRISNYGCDCDRCSYYYSSGSSSCCDRSFSGDFR